MSAPEIKFKEGDLIFFESANPYINGLKSKDAYEFGIIDHIYFDGYGVDIYELFDTRKIEGIPVKDYDFYQKRRKLPKNWSHNTDLIHLTWDNQPDGYNGQAFNRDNEGYRKGIEWGVFVPRSSQDREGYPEVDINKEGYLIAWKHQQYKISKITYTLVPFNKAYGEPSEYAKDVVLNTERVKTNRNILKKEHYIVITYSPLEDLTSTDMYDKEELKEKAFSELYIRCQSLIRVLNSCDVNGKILNSIELAELLYVAYNREQYEIYGIDKVLNSQYNQLYVTAEDILDKKMKRLDEKVEIDAINHATEILTRVKSEKEKELQYRKENIDKMVRKMTEMILEQNKNRIEEDVFQRAKQVLEEENTREEEGDNEKEKAKKIKRRRTTGSNI